MSSKQVNIVLAAWRDVQQKAKRLFDEGAVTVLRHDRDIVATTVRGDNSSYDVVLKREDPSSMSISQWECTCPWGEWAFKRQVTYVGRMCSHALASLYKAQSLDYRRSSIDHVLGDSGVQLSLFPETVLVRKRKSKISRRDFSEIEKFGLIDEESEGAANLLKLDLTGTHYEEYDPEEIFLMSLM